MLKTIDYEEYLSLDEDTRRYFDSINAKELLDKSDDENQFEFKLQEKSIVFEPHMVVNLAQIDRSGEYIYYGGTVICQNFTAKKISIQVYLIRKSDGKVIANASESKTSVKQYGLLKKKEISKNGTLYYAKSVATVTAPDTYVPSQKVITHSSANEE